jgi:hypothetical protein
LKICHRHHWHGHKAQINQLLSIIIQANTAKWNLQRQRERERERERERVLSNCWRWKRFRRSGPGGGDIREDGAVVTIGRRGPGGGDGREDDMVPGRGGDG